MSDHHGITGKTLLKEMLNTHAPAKPKF